MNTIYNTEILRENFFELVEKFQQPTAKAVGL